MKSSTFTICHGFAGSIVLHMAAALLLLIALRYSAPEVDDTLIIEFQGSDSDVQAEERNRRQNRGTSATEESVSQKEGAAIDEREEERPDPTTDDGLKERSKEQEKEGARASPAASNPGLADLEGADEQQSAQTIQRRAEEQMNQLKTYVRALSKKIQAKLIYPKEVRRAGFEGVATVSFKILPDGGVSPESLKIVASSGKQWLDASALNTIRTCAPFAPPPREITVTIAVTYSRKR